MNIINLPNPIAIVIIGNTGGAARTAVLAGKIPGRTLRVTARGSGRGEKEGE